MTTRIDTRFAALKREGRAGLVTFVTAGDPDPNTSLAILKALPVADAADLAPVPAYVPHVARFLFDAKPPKTPQALPGGNGLAFDWRLIRDLDPGRPVMLSGGLDPSNVARAIEVTGVSAVDVSSGVESAPGVKDPDRIVAFIRNARAAVSRA